ncbi:uncharacterized protein LOC144363093 [Saccoglossus kowalevskii]
MPNVVLRPSQIYFLHDSIDCRFQDKTNMLETFRQLLYKEINPAAIQPIAVFDKNDKWWVYAGNRRLYLFRKLEEYGVVKYITAWKVRKIDPDEWKKRNTTTNGGRSVSIRNARQFEAKMQNIVREWRSNRRGTNIAICHAYHNQYGESTHREPYRHGNIVTHNNDHGERSKALFWIVVLLIALLWLTTTIFPNIASRRH